MFLRLENFKGKVFAGRKVGMSFSNDRTRELWQGFMPRIKTITNAIGTDLYCLQVYPSTMDFKSFDPITSFDKWAAVEIASADTLPDNMEKLVVKEGLYAVFLHKGAAVTGPVTFTYIFTEWLPSSVYLLDDRPHFEILGEKYKNDQPDSEEEIWIPVKGK
jgi:AraC family transcriptional regulator